MLSRTIRRSLLTGAAALALAAGALGATPVAAADEANLSVVLIPQTDTASTADGVDSYRVLVTNHGDGEVKQVTVSVPFAAGYSIAGASFDRGGSWVARLGAESLDLRIEQMRGNGDTVSGTLRFASQGPAASNALLERATVTWRGDERATPNASNLPVSLQAATFSAAALPEGVQGHSFRAAAFASGEPVSLWYTNSAGVSTALVIADGVAIPAYLAEDDDDDQSYGTSLAANGQGELQALVSLPRLSPGTYTLAARGDWSGTIAAASFTVR
jgi:hypothetical protein